MAEQSRIIAVLGPTNTGKTHYAIERMLGYNTGIIALPLRLLAREVYDKIAGLRGRMSVALITGEERIVPDKARYWVCTTESMPQGLAAEFVAIDEIQLCADPERGHVFTERLLSARGLFETLFLGADTIRPVIAELVPDAQFVRRDRLSELTYTGEKKISRMLPRSAIVAFSVENVYAIAELLRRQKGGAAVVMGALSPRTRNAQVDLYQNGDVDYLVATDAIGMGLNLDIRHVAFAGTNKFDGRRMRPLMPNELAQIAGRAGRHMQDGTFGTTGDAGPLPDETATAICDNQFAPVKRVHWRNSELDFSSLGGLIASLERPTDDPLLVRARDADDLAALKTLAERPAVQAMALSKGGVEQLWDVCRIPDFRDISAAEHAAMLEQIFEYLRDLHRVPDDWLARQVKRLDRTDGDIDTLSKRLAYIRTWTYVAQRKGWVDDEKHWRGETRAVEDRLSDALHGALTQRFVDRRTSVLMRRLKQKEHLVASVNENGDVTVEDQFVGRIEGFRFRQDKSASPDEAKTLRAASVAALKPEFHLRADRFYNSPDTEIDFTEQGGLMWGEHAVGKLVAGAEPLKPVAEAFVDEEAGPEVVQKVQRRLQHFIDRKVATLFEPLIAMQRDEALTGQARGFAFRMIEGFGILPRDAVADEVKALDQDTRGVLRKHGIRFGQFTIFMPLLLKPAPTRLRLVLWALASGLKEFPESPPPGLVTIPTAKDAPTGYHGMSGYRKAGERAIRIDMLERLADMLRTEDSRAGFEAKADMLSITGMTLEQFADLMQGLGYRAEKGERAKVKAVPEAPVEAEAKADVAPEAGEKTKTTDAADAEAQVPTEGADPDPAQADAAKDVPAAAEDTKTAEADADDGGTAEVTDSDAMADPAENAEGTEDAAEPEVEVFYTFRWRGNRPARPQSERGKRPPRKGKGKPKGKPGGGDKARNFSARPPKKDEIDPDNPFAAALMGLKDKS